MSTASENYSSTTDSTALTITLASLATSSTRVAGRQTTIVTNVTNKYLDCEVYGQITTGTSPTANKSIEVWIFVPISVASSTFVYPIAGATVLGESDAAATFDAEQKSGGVILAATMATNATSDRKYSFAFSLREKIGYMPLKWGLWVTHDTGVNLNSTAGNHWAHYIGHKADIA